MDFQVHSSSPSYDTRELQAVERVIDNQYTAEGPEAEQFEREISSFIGRSSAVTTSSGTTALHLILKALGIGEGDEVILPSYTCQSLLHPIFHVGAKPVVADVDPTTFSLSRETVEPHLTSKTGLIILVHTFGYPVDDPDIFDVDVPVLEDLAQAIGAELPDGEHVGQRGFAAMGSLYATKQLASGYGGFVAADDPEFLEDLRDLKHYDERSNYRPAFNYSLSDLNASLARTQLEKHDEHQSVRRQIADRYDSTLADVSSVSPPDRPEGHALYRYVIEHPSPDPLIEHMTEDGIEVKRPVYEPLHRSLHTPDRSTAEALHDSLIMLPLHPEMTPKKSRLVLDSLETFA